MSRTLYVSDLDGTLLQPDARISDTSRRILTRAIDEGKLFTIATARTPATVAAILDGLPLPLPAIVMTGVAFWDTHTRKYSEVQYMDPALVERLVSIYRRNGCPTFIYTLPDQHIEMYHIGPLSGIERDFLEARVGNPFKSIRIPGWEDPGLPAEWATPQGVRENIGRVILFYGMQPAPISKRVYEESQRLGDANPQFYFDFYGPEIGIIEQFSPEATKAKAIRRLAERAEADRIVVFGDNVNDLPMMREADIAVAVANAIPAVKEAADIIIGPNTEDSVARFIAND